MRSGTVLAANKLPLRTSMLAVHLLTSINIAALESMRHLGIIYKTFWRIKYKVMQAMAKREAQCRLSSFIHIDDTYLGGKRNGGKDDAPPARDAARVGPTFC